MVSTKTPNLVLETTISLFEHHILSLSRRLFDFSTKSLSIQIPIVDQQEPVPPAKPAPMQVENSLPSRSEFLAKEITPPDCVYCGVPIGLPDKNGLIELPYYTECRHIVGDVCFWQAIVVDPRCPHGRKVLCEDDKVRGPDWKMMAEQNFSLAFRLYQAKRASWDEQYEETFKKIDWTKIVQEAEVTGEKDFRFSRLCDFWKLQNELLGASQHLCQYAQNDMQCLMVKLLHRSVVQTLGKIEAFFNWMHIRVHCLQRQIETFELFLQTIEVRISADQTKRFRKNVFSTFHERIHPFRFQLSDAKELARMQAEGKGEILRDDGNDFAKILAAFVIPPDFIISQISSLERDREIAIYLDLDTKRSRMRDLGQGMGEVIFEAAVAQLLRVWVHDMADEDLFFLTPEEKQNLEGMVNTRMQACAKITGAIHDYNHLLRLHNLPREDIVRLPMSHDRES